MKKPRPNLYYLSAKALKLELTTATFLRTEEKAIFEILIDGALNVNQIKNKLEDNGFNKDYSFIKNILIQLNEEGWVKIR